MWKLYARLSTAVIISATHGSLYSTAEEVDHHGKGAGWVQEPFQLQATRPPWWGHWGLLREGEGGVDQQQPGRLVGQHEEDVGGGVRGDDEGDDGQEYCNIVDGHWSSSCWGEMDFICNNSIIIDVFKGWTPAKIDDYNDVCDNCDHNFGTFDDFGVKNYQKVSHNMILMSKYKGQHGGKKGKKIWAGASPPLFGQCPKENIFSLRRASLRLEINPKHILSKKRLDEENFSKLTIIPNLFNAKYYWWRGIQFQIFLFPGMKLKHQMIWCNTGNSELSELDLTSINDFIDIVFNGQWVFDK